MRRLWLAFVTPCISAAALSAIVRADPPGDQPPATSPTTNPANKPLKPKPNEREVVDPRAGFRVIIPKAWRVIDQKAGMTGHVFQLPDAQKNLRVTPSWVITADPVAPGADLAAAAKVARERILARNPKAKFLKDEASTVGAFQGWEFVYETELKVTVVTNPGNITRTEMAPARVRDQLIVANEVAYEFVLCCDARGFDIRSRLVDRALETFTLTTDQN